MMTAGSIEQPHDDNDDLKGFRRRLEELLSSDARIAGQFLEVFPEEASLIGDGLAIHLEALLQLEATQIGAAAQSVQVGVVVRAFNSLLAVRNSLLSGYTTQAFIAMRSAFEDLITYHHLNKNPADAERWQQGTYSIPSRESRLNSMPDDLRAKVRKVNRVLDEFVHPGKLGVVAALKADGKTLTLRVGGNLDERHVRIVVYPLLFGLNLLHLALEEMVTAMKGSAQKEWTAAANAFDQRAAAWTRESNAEMQDKESS